MPLITFLQSVAIGSSGGLTVFAAGILKDEYFKWRDKKRVFDFMRSPVNFSFRTTRSIANNVNLTEDRVRLICSIHPKIKRNKRDIEAWRLDNEVEA